MSSTDVCLKQWLAPGADAVKEFDAALSLDGSDRVAANNRAVCRMYACNLPGAIQVSIILPASADDILSFCKAANYYCSG